MIRVVFLPKIIHPACVEGVIEFHTFGKGIIGKCIGTADKSGCNLLSIDGKSKITLRDNKLQRTVIELMQTYYAANNNKEISTWVE
jgi:hypothetical protein